MCGLFLCGCLHDESVRCSENTATDFLKCRTHTNKGRPEHAHQNRHTRSRERKRKERGKARTGRRARVREKMQGKGRAGKGDGNGRWVRKTREKALESSIYNDTSRNFRATSHCDRLHLNLRK